MGECLPPSVTASLRFTSRVTPLPFPSPVPATAPRPLPALLPLCPQNPTVRDIFLVRHLVNVSQRVEWEARMSIATGEPVVVHDAAGAPIPYEANRTYFAIETT